MEAAQIIRNAISAVLAIRESAARDSELQTALAEVKQFQSLRFAHTYSDLSLDDRYRHAVEFFLTDLYGETSYAERDGQFFRVAGALQRLLPKSALHTAVALAQLHQISEQLDLQMAKVWLLPKADKLDRVERYCMAWRQVANREHRAQQLQLVLDIGAKLDNLTKRPGLRMLLTAMRRPASAAKLGAMQHFLERGFDSFQALGRTKGGAKLFLATILTRETELMAALFDGDLSHFRLQVGNIQGNATVPSLDSRSLDQ